MFIARSSRRAALFAAVLLAAGALPAAAQAQSGAADPQAAVPATVYQPAIVYRPEAANDSTPDRNWAQNNAIVAATNSMSLTMKGMKGAAGPHSGPHSGHPMPAAPASASTAAEGTPPSGPQQHHQESR